MNASTLTKNTAAVFILTLFLTGSAYAKLLDTEIFKGNMVKVTQKYPNCIVIKSHSLDLPSDNIILSPTSRIMDINGNIISIENLKLPCAAKINYYLKAKMPDAHLIKLEILEYADKTSTRFKSKKPFLRLAE